MKRVKYSCESFSFVLAHFAYATFFDSFGVTVADCHNVSARHLGQRGNMSFFLSPVSAEQQSDTYIPLSRTLSPVFTVKPLATVRGQLRCRNIVLKLR